MGRLEVLDFHIQLLSPIEDGKVLLQDIEDLRTHSLGPCHDVKLQDRQDLGLRDRNAQGFCC